MWGIYSFLDWQWWVYFGWFGVALIFSWFIPGLVILSYTKLAKSIQFYVAPILGLCLWGLQGYFFGWLNFRFMGFLWPILFGLWAVKRWPQLKPLEWQLKLPKLVWSLLGLGVLLQLIPVWGSGWRTAAGIKYFFVNIFDGLFHLSLARATIDHVPPFQPGAVGLPVTNYHYISNLIMGELTRVWQLPLDHLYFQYLPIFLAFWLGLLLVLLLQKWSSSNWTLVLGLLLFYAVGELSWLVNLVLGSHSQVPFEVFIDHGAIQFLNPPQAFAKVVFFATLLLWQQLWRTKKDWRLAAVIGVMTATLVGLKVYFGVAALVGVGAVILVKGGMWLWQNWRQPQTLTDKSEVFKTLGAFTCLLVLFGSIGAAIYLPANAGAGGLFFDFLTWPKLLLGASKLNWNEWWLRLQVYQAAGSIKNLTIWYSLAAAIFGVAIYHLRILGLLAVFKKYRQRMMQEEVIFLVAPALLFSIIGANFLQTSGGANSFNFTVVALTILGPLTAVVIDQLTQAKWLKILCYLLLAITLVQTVVLEAGFLRNYVLGYDSQTISPAHEAALKYLTNQDKKTTLLQTLPGQYLDEGTPYLYFFTDKFSYVGGRGILESHNQPIKDRVGILKTFLTLPASSSAVLATKLHITHLVLLKTESVERNFYLQTLHDSTNSASPRWRESFANEETIILSPELPVQP